MWCCRQPDQQAQPMHWHLASSLQAASVPDVIAVLRAQPTPLDCPTTTAPLAPSHIAREDMLLICCATPHQGTPASSCSNLTGTSQQSHSRSHLGGLTQHHQAHVHHWVRLPSQHHLRTQTQHHTPHMPPFQEARVKMATCITVAQAYKFIT